LITIDDGRVLQALLDADADFGGEPHSQGIYGRTKDSICIGVEQLLTAYNDETTGLFRVTVLRVPNAINLAAPHCG
jgi:hypothetical protein